MLKNEPTHIKNSFLEFLSQIDYTDIADLISIKAAWNENFTQFAKADDIIKTFNEGVLYLTTNHPAMRYELNLRKNNLIFILNKALGKDIIAEITINIK